MSDLQQGQQVASNPTDPGAVEPAATGTTPETTTGTGETQSGQATDVQAQGAPAEESFTDVDPKTLPPELQAVYRKMQAGFTKKMQGASEAQKKAAEYDQLMGDQRFTNYWKALAAEGQNQTKEPEPLITEQEYAEALSSPQGMEKLMQKVVQQAVQPLQDKVRVAEASEVLQEFAAAGHEDLYELQEDQLISIQLELDPPRNRDDYRAKVEQAYTRAKELTQKYFQKGYQKATAEKMGVIQDKVNASSTPPTLNPGKTYEGPDPKTLSAGDAFRLAKKGVRVPQS